MDSKEVGEKSKALQKATAASDPPENIIRILNELKTGIKADEDLLRSTKIGVIVNRSKQHSDPNVARLASEIVKKWRDDVQKAKASSPSGKKSPNGASSPAPSKETNGKPKLEIPPAERDYKKDKVNTNRTNQSTRDNCIGLLYNGLCYMSTAPPSEVLRVAIAVEAAGFAELGPESNDGYVTKMRSLFMNLKAKSNPTLRVRVMEGNIAPDALVRMKNEDLKSDKRREEDKKLMRENMKEGELQTMKLILMDLTCVSANADGGEVHLYQHRVLKSQV
ncbi:RNA polymerase II elongation factor [Mycoblastus sanguinarius]|nr:RNA polymerase II elongation factor [Mycoblastus sanguinarius]